MIAETILGDGEAAFDYYKRTNPSARAPISDVHRCEPYVYAQMIAGRDAATPARRRTPGLTGSASWHLTAISQWILGVRPELGGLRIDPVLPPTWPGFTARRRWRGRLMRSWFTKNRAWGRVQRLVVDGTSVEGSSCARHRRGQLSGSRQPGARTAVVLTEPVRFAPAVGGATRRTGNLDT